jgi:hypothetical protein
LQPITNVYDFNRDQVVNINDELVSRFNSGFLTRNLTWSPVGDPMAAAEDSGAAVASALAIKAVTAPVAEPLVQPSLVAVSAPAEARAAAFASLLLESVSSESLVGESDSEPDDDLLASVV